MNSNNFRSLCMFVCSTIVKCGFNRFVIIIRKVFKNFFFVFKRFLVDFDFYNIRTLFYDDRSVMLKFYELRFLLEIN